MKILVAEDEPNIAESYKLFLGSLGHEVVVTHDGEQCLDIYLQEHERAKQSKSSRAFSSTPFDLVILDYRMPKKDGIQVAIQVRSIVASQRILLASAYTYDLSVAELQKNSATQSIEIIQKPFEFDQFLKIVENDKHQVPIGNAKDPIYCQHIDQLSYHSSKTITSPGTAPDDYKTKDSNTNEFFNMEYFIDNIFKLWN